MKKFFLIAIIIIATLAGANGQNYKWWVGGRTNLWIDDYSTSFSVAPEVGYQITPKLTIATALAYHAVSYDSSDKNSLKPDFSGYVVNPYIRFTTFKSGILLGFIDGGMEFGLGDYEGFQIGLKPGIAILLSNRITAATQFGFIGYNDGLGIGKRSKGIGFDLSGYCSTIAFFYSF